MAAAAKTADAAPAGPAAATVNGTAIPQRTVDNIARQAAASGRPDTPETRKTIVDQLALQMVVADEAVKKGLDKNPEVAEQIDAMRQSVLANAYVRDYMKNNPVTDDMLKAEYDRIKATIRAGASPRHVPAKVIAVADIPRTRSGKLVELAVRDVVHGRPVSNREALANPEALELFADLAELKE